MVALEQGYSRQAEAHFLEGLKINPDHTLLLIALGRLYIEMRQYKAAVSTLRKVVQQDPAQGEAWLELGRAHMKLNEWKLALSALEQALQLDPYVPQIYSAMAICYLKLNKKIEARQKVQEALQRDPNNAEAIRLQKQL
jgi:Tfp pilus assembly protein PilF